jgi:hypothetical protein
MPCGPQGYVRIFIDQNKKKKKKKKKKEQRFSHLLAGRTRLLQCLGACVVSVQSISLSRFRLSKLELQILAYSVQCRCTGFCYISPILIRGFSRSPPLFFLCAGHETLAAAIFRQIRSNVLHAGKQEVLFLRCSSGHSTLRSACSGHSTLRSACSGHSTWHPQRRSWLKVVINKEIEC